MIKFGICKHAAPGAPVVPIVKDNLVGKVDYFNHLSMTDGYIVYEEMGEDDWELWPLLVPEEWS